MFAMRLSSKAPKTFALVAAVLLGGATLGLLAARRSVLFLTVPMVVAAVVVGALFLYGLIRLFLEEQRALRAGMLRPRRGFAVHIREDALEVTMPGQHATSIPITAIRRALFVRDDLVPLARPR